MQLEWELLENKSFDKKISELTGSDILSQILANRGIDSYEKAFLFLNPQNYPISSPDNFLDIEKSVERIKNAIQKGEHIVIYGDFDCDGVTSTATLYKTLIKLGAKVGCYIPDRKKENHGLNSKAVIEIISKQRARLIITVDNGISNISEIKLAQSLGTDVIVTDHHEPPESLPPAFAIINPKCSEKISENLEFNEIQNMVNFAGVMVIYKLCCKLLEEFDIPEFKNELLPYVMLGTISDVMPLIGENRTTVCLGLDIINNNTPKWLQKLKELAGGNTDTFNSEAMAFMVAPRINAAGRLEHATTALELLVADDDEKINFCANKLNQFNQTRQQMCDTFIAEAINKIHNEIDLKTTKSIVLADEKWHIGIVGLLASKIVEKYNRPAFIMTIDKEENKARCSIRGIKGLNVHNVLAQMEEYFEGYGGHELAGGFGVDLNKFSIKQIREKINQIVLQELEGISLKKKITIDALLEPQDLTPEFVKMLSVLEPFGEGNRSCIFGIENLTLKKTEILKNSHLKLYFESKDKHIFEGFIWGQNSHNIELLDIADVTFVPKINEFNGNEKVQLHIKNIFIKNRTIQAKNIDFDENAQSQTKLVDHRKKTNFFKMLNSYLTNNPAEVYLENKEILQELSNYTTIKSMLKNRFDINKCEELILLSTPCSEEVFLEIVKKADAQKIHIFNTNDKKLEINEYIKTTSGMLKYCSTHNDGKIEINKALSHLASSEETFNECIELLCDAGVIKLNEKTQQFYSFEFIESKPLNDIVQSQKYNELSIEIEKTNNFKEDFQNCELTQIKEML